jgi:hypothetical protein
MSTNRVSCLCPLCNGKLIPAKREREHRRAQFNPHAAPDQASSGFQSRLECFDSAPDDSETSESDEGAEGQDVGNPLGADLMVESPIHAETPPLFEQQGGLPTVHIFRGDVSDSDDEPNVPDEGSDDDGLGEEFWEGLDKFPEWISGLSEFDQAHEWYERETAEIGVFELLLDIFRPLISNSAEKLTAYDRAICRAFSYKVQTHTTDRDFAKLPYAFPSDSPLPGLDGVRARVSFLAGFKPEQYDCCINSCCCFTGSHESLDNCPYCNEARRTANGKPRKKFTYIPLIPRLLAFFRNREFAKQMLYRSTFKSNPELVCDVFDGTHYQELLGQRVEIDGTEQSHNYFSDPRDIAAGISTDGFALWKKRKTTSWPIILFNFNLPPEVRFHAEHILALGVIPGPKKPVDFDSFLWPAMLEFIQLLKGVAAFDILQSELFLLHLYLILGCGDIPAISLLIHVKGHNGISPCRMCEILGLRVPDSRATTHYVPLFRGNHPTVLATPEMIKDYNPRSLPLRTHHKFLQQAREVQAAPTNASANELAKRYGIKGVPLLSHLSSLRFPASFPFDFMHLIYQNLLPNLVLHWTGEFKGLDDGNEDYTLPKSVWEAVGEATAQSGATIPSAYGSRVPNLATNRSHCSAEMWSFWALYIGPILLRRRFQRPKYFKHFVLLVKLINSCLQFEFSREDVATIRDGFIQWVLEYEQCVFF